MVTTITNVEFREKGFFDPKIVQGSEAVNAKEISWTLRQRLR